MREGDPLCSELSLTDRLRGVDRLECLSPLFELVSALHQAPFKLEVDVYVTGPDSQHDDSNRRTSEKIIAEKDPEVTAALPSLTRQSSGSIETDDVAETVGKTTSRDRSYRSLYAAHSGRPDVATIIRAFASDAEGESLAVAGKFPIQLAWCFGKLIQDLSHSLWARTTQRRRWECLCRPST